MNALDIIIPAASLLAILVIVRFLLKLFGFTRCDTCKKRTPANGKTVWHDEVSGWTSECAECTEKQAKQELPAA